ncbi:MAG: DUF5678 domain-containing protein [Ardenticatenaceae bacterium]
MKTIEVKATPTHYFIEVEQKMVAQQATLLQREGESVAALIPMSDYQAFVAWQATRPKAVAAPSQLEFEREVAAFEKLKPMLMKKYEGRVVAIHQGQVVAVGDDKMDVLDMVWEKFGEVPCYIEWVETETPRRVRVPSVRVVNR